MILSRIDKNGNKLAGLTVKNLGEATKFLNDTFIMAQPTEYSMRGEDGLWLDNVVVSHNHGKFTVEYTLMADYDEVGVVILHYVLEEKPDA